MKSESKKLFIIAASVAIFLHLIILGFYGYFTLLDSGYFGETKSLKIRLGSEREIELDPTPVLEEIIESETPEEEPEIAKEEPKLQDNVTNQDPPPPAQPRKEPKNRGSKYGNSTDPDAILPKDYLDILQVTIHENNVIPPQAISQNIHGKGTLQLTFDRSGYVTAYRLVRSTGNKILDDAALVLAQRFTHSPLPMPPRNFYPSEQTLTFRFNVSY